MYLLKRRRRIFGNCLGAYPSVCITMASLFFNCLCTIYMIQGTWTAQVRPPPEAIRRAIARVRVSRLPHETGGRERVCSAQTHAFAWTASRAGLGGGSGAGFGCSQEEGWSRVRRRGRDAWEEEETGYGRGTGGRGRCRLVGLIKATLQYGLSRIGAREKDRCANLSRA